MASPVNVSFFLGLGLDPNERRRMDAVPLQAFDLRQGGCPITRMRGDG
jgi:hypothetical protein